MTAAMLWDMIKEILCTYSFFMPSEKFIDEGEPYHSFPSFTWFTGLTAFIQIRSVYY